MLNMAIVTCSAERDIPRSACIGATKSVQTYWGLEMAIIATTPRNNCQLRPGGAGEARRRAMLMACVSLKRRSEWLRRHVSFMTFD